MMRNLIVLAAILIAAALYTVTVDHNAQPRIPAPPQTQTNPSSENAAAPEFSFKDLSGKTYSLSDFKGRVFILNFWASWCAPCVKEFPQMLDLAAMTRNESVFLFLSVDEKKEDIERFIKRYGKNLPAPNVVMGWDPDKSISQSLFQTYKLPETYILTPGHVISEKIIGADIVWNTPGMKAKIKNLHAAP